MCFASPSRFCCLHLSAAQAAVWFTGGVSLSTGVHHTDGEMLQGSRWPLSFSVYLQSTYPAWYSPSLCHSLISLLSSNVVLKWFISNVNRQSVQGQPFLKDVFYRNVLPSKSQTNLFITSDGLHGRAVQLKEQLNQNSNAALYPLYISKGMW